MQSYFTHAAYAYILCWILAQMLLDGACGSEGFLYSSCLLSLMSIFFYISLIVFFFPSWFSGIQHWTKINSSWFYISNLNTLCRTITTRQSSLPGILNFSFSFLIFTFLILLPSHTTFLFTFCVFLSQYMFPGEQKLAWLVELQFL